MLLQLLACLLTWSTAISQLSMRAKSLSHLVTFPQLRVTQLMKRVSAPGAPSIDYLPVLIQTRSITASKCISKLAQSRHPSASPNSLNHCLQVHLETRSIAASKCISKLAWLQPPSSHDHGLQVQISKLARSWPPSASPNSLDRDLQVHLQSRSIMASKCISELARSQPSSVSLHMPDYSLHVRMITASKCISKLARSRPRRVSLSSLDRHFQALLELLTSTACI